MTLFQKKPEAPAEPATTLAERYTSAALRPVKVLLVEDSATDRELIRNVLLRFNVDLIEAVGKLDAISLANSLPFEMALVDMRLPWEGNGVAVMQALRLQAPLLPICAYSSQISPSDIAHICEAVGVVTFAPKLLVITEGHVRELFKQFGLAQRAGMIP